MAELIISTCNPYFRKVSCRSSLVIRNEKLMSLHQYQNLVVTQPNCPFCVKAKAILDERGTEYVTLSLGSDLDKQEMIDYIEEIANVVVNTVPQIILDGEYIGGHDDLVAKLDREEVADDSFSDFEL